MPGDRRPRRGDHRRHRVQLHQRGARRGRTRSRTLVATAHRACPAPRSSIAALFTLLGPLLLGARGREHRRQDRRTCPPPRSSRSSAPASTRRAGLERRSPGGAGSRRARPHALGRRAGRRRGRGRRTRRGRLVDGRAHRCSRSSLSPVLGFARRVRRARGSRRLLRRATRARSSDRSASGQWVSSGGARVRPRCERRGEGDGRDRRSCSSRPEHATRTSAPLWVKLLATGPRSRSARCVGGWRIVRTVGMRIFRLRPLDGLREPDRLRAHRPRRLGVGAPVSTSQVVASSVAGVGGSGSAGTTCTGRWCGQIGLAWLVTMPGLRHARARSPAPLWRWLT